MTKITIPDEVLKQPSRVDKPKEVAKGRKSTKKPASKNVGDPSFDLIKVFEQRDIADMDDEEYEMRIKNLREMRLIRFTTIKKVSALDLILANIDVNKAREHLERLKEYDDKKKKQSETGHEN